MDSPAPPTPPTLDGEQPLQPAARIVPPLPAATDRDVDDFDVDLRLDEWFGRRDRPDVDDVDDIDLREHQPDRVD